MEHLSETQLTGYSRRILDPDELLAVDRHLASCDECHDRLTPISPAIKPSLESDEGPFHLDYEQHLAPYVDGTANEIDREIVDSHVAVCSKCAADLNDLLEFRQPVAVIAEDTRASSRWKQWVPQLSLPSNPVWSTAGAVLAVLILGMAIFLWTRHPAPRPGQLADTASPEPVMQGLPAKEQPSPALMEPSPQINASMSPANDASSTPEEPLLVLNDAGGQVIVTRRGRLEGLQELPPDLRESVERAWATRRLGTSPALTGWSTGAGSLRSGSETQSTFAPLSPTDVVTETDRPTFHWRALEGAQHYNVTIYDAQLHKVGSSGPVSGTEWTTPNSLARGGTYSWQISALKEGETVVSPKPPLPEARFRVLDQLAVAVLAKLNESARRSHLAMGVFYWKHGLIEKSVREFQALAAANPNSATVKELLASVQSTRHH